MDQIQTEIDDLGWRCSFPGLEILTESRKCWNWLLSKYQDLFLGSDLGMKQPKSFGKSRFLTLDFNQKGN